MPSEPSPTTGALIEAKPPRRPPLVPERIDLFEGDEPAEEKVSAFLARVIPAAEEARQSPAGALVAWVCNVLLSEHSVKAYGRDLAHFVGHMRELGIVDPLSVNADHLKLYKAALLKAGINPDRIDGRGIGIHSLRKTAINDAIRNGAQMHEVREFAGHSDTRTTELYFVRREEDAEMAARRIQIRVPIKQ